jgi:AcrR family transcriptional regulator
MTTTQLAMDRRQHSKEALLNAAITLFVQNGYEAVSTREIAEAAGVNLGAIQYHFGSKAKLFVESVRTLMEAEGCAGDHLDLEGAIESREEAIAALATFVHSFLDYLLRRAGPRACRVMFREVFTSTARDDEMFEALVSSTVADFMKPVDDLLLRIIRQLHPNLTSNEAGRYAGSIIGQCVFYVTHRPFVERMRGYRLEDPGIFEETATHVTQFSLRGLGCSEEELRTALSTNSPLTVCNTGDTTK